MCRHRFKGYRCKSEKVPFDWKFKLEITLACPLTATAKNKP